MSEARIWVDGEELSARAVGLLDGCEPVDVTPVSEPDPDWWAVDPTGHYHAMSEDKPHYPTLLGVIEHVDHEAGPECDADDAECRAVYRCRLCGADVAPGTRAVTGRRYAPGVRYWLVRVTGLGECPAVVRRVREASVRVVGDGREAFGIAAVVEVRVDRSSWELDLVGIGVLGRRAAR